MTSSPSSVRRHFLRVLATTASQWAAGSGAQAASDRLKRIVDRALQKPGQQAPSRDTDWPGVPAHGLRWAI